MIDAAKHAGFSLDEVRVLLLATDQGEPAHEQLRALAERKLPEVDALIDRAQTMRAWLTTATTCGCDTLDACALFADSNGSANSLHRCRAVGRAAAVERANRFGGGAWRVCGETPRVTSARLAEQAS